VRTRIAALVAGTRLVAALAVCAMRLSRRIVMGFRDMASFPNTHYDLRVIELSSYDSLSRDWGRRSLFCLSSDSMDCGREFRRSHCLAQRVFRNTVRCSGSQGWFWLSLRLLVAFGWKQRSTSIAQDTSSVAKRALA
jgi:hypothetical protein